MQKPTPSDLATVSLRIDPQTSADPLASWQTDPLTAEDLIADRETADELATDTRLAEIEASARYATALGF